MTCVSLGNPHAVVFVEDLAAVDLPVVGPQFENASEFPQRVNAHFVRVDSAQQVTMRTWERGSGATLACGTGAAASIVAARRAGLADDEARVLTRGGELRASWDGHGQVHVEGPATTVFLGRWPAATDG